MAFSRFALLPLLSLCFVASHFASAQTGSGCIAHHPNYIEGVLEVTYDSGCSGHDEPELMPLSDARVLMILVTADHVVRNRVVSLEHPISAD